jgi:Protein of unknown function (DUF2442)
MLNDIIEVRPLGGYRLFLRFENGVEGEVDLADQIRFDGVFAALREPANFAQVRVNSEVGTIVWPNGADLDPDVLYSIVTGQPVACNGGNSGVV